MVLFLEREGYFHYAVVIRVQLVYWMKSQMIVCDEINNVFAPVSPGEAVTYIYIGLQYI